MDRYLSGEELNVKSLIGDLETAVARGSFYPVVPVCAATQVGLDSLLELLTRAFPSPLEHDVPPVAYLTDVLRKLANDWPERRLEELLPDRWQLLHGSDPLTIAISSASAT